MSFVQFSALILCVLYGWFVFFCFVFFFGGGGGGPHLPSHKVTRHYFISDERSVFVEPGRG